MECEFRHPYQELQFSKPLDAPRYHQWHEEVKTFNKEAAIAIRLPVVEQLVKNSNPEDVIHTLDPLFMVNKVLQLENVIRRRQHWKTFRFTTDRPLNEKDMPTFNHALYPWAKDLMILLRNEIDLGSQCLEKVKIVQRDLLLTETYARLFLENPLNEKWRKLYPLQDFLIRVWAWDIHSKVEVYKHTIRTKDGVAEVPLPLSLASQYDMDLEMCQEFANFKATRMAMIPENVRRTFAYHATEESIKAYNFDVYLWYRNRQTALKEQQIFDTDQLAERFHEYLEWEAECELVSIHRRVERCRESSLPAPPQPKTEAEVIRLAIEFRNHRLAVGLPPYAHWEKQCKLADHYQRHLPCEHGALPAMIDTFLHRCVEEREDAAAGTTDGQCKLLPTQLFAKKLTAPEDEQLSLACKPAKIGSPRKQFSAKRIAALRTKGLQEENSSFARKVVYDLLLDFLHANAFKRGRTTFMDSLFELPIEKLVDLVAIYVLHVQVMEHYKFAQRMAELLNEDPAPNPLMPHAYVFGQEFFVY
ncbi:hypothetical protein M569_09140, partial [Genlisea aurea]